MASRLLKNLKVPGIIILCLAVFLAVFFLSPTIARAEGEAATTEETDTAEKEKKQAEEAPVPEGSASIGDVTVKDGATGTETTISTQPELQDALGAPDDTKLNYGHL